MGLIGVPAVKIVDERIEASGLKQSFQLRSIHIRHALKNPVPSTPVLPWRKVGDIAPKSTKGTVGQNRPLRCRG